MSNTLIAIDANILIYFIDRHKEFGESSRQLLTAVASGAQPAVGSELLYLEVLAFQKLQKDADVKRVRDFIERSGMRVRPIDKRTLLKAAEVRRANPAIKMPDAVHASTAILAGASYLVTNDRPLLKRKIEGLTLLPLLQAADTLAGISHADKL